MVHPRPECRTEPAEPEYVFMRGHGGSFIKCREVGAMEAPVGQGVRAVPGGCCTDRASDLLGKRCARQAVPESCETCSKDANLTASSGER